MAPRPQEDERGHTVIQPRSVRRPAEPQLEDVMADPIVRLLMASDRVRLSDLAAVIATAREALRRSGR